MWFRGGGASWTSGASMLTATTFVRHFSRKRAENLRKINPKVTRQEASSIAQDIYHLIKQNGPLTVSNAWVHVQESGISGLNSKTHMKLMLKWMRGRKMLKLLCNHVGSSKKFLLSTLPEEPQTERLKHPSELKLQTEKPSVKGRKKTG